MGEEAARRLGVLRKGLIENGIPEDLADHIVRDAAQTAFSSSVLEV